MDILSQFNWRNVHNFIHKSAKNIDIAVFIMDRSNST